MEVNPHESRESGYTIFDPVGKLQSQYVSVENEIRNFATHLIVDRNVQPELVVAALDNVRCEILAESRRKETL